MVSLITWNREENFFKAQIKTKTKSTFTLENMESYKIPTTESTNKASAIVKVITDKKITI